MVAASTGQLSHTQVLGTRPESDFVSTRRGEYFACKTFNRSRYCVGRLPRNNFQTRTLTIDLKKTPREAQSNYAVTCTRLVFC